MRYKDMEVCECDRCGEKETLTTDAPNQAAWHDMQRYTETGTIKPFLLCKGCYEKYVEFSRVADVSFDKWMAV